MAGIDPIQFERWFDVYAARLKAYARQWLDSQRAEDIVQDVFVRLLAGNRAPDNPPAWLFTAVRNAAASERRSEARRQRRESAAADAADLWFEPDIAAPIDAAEAQRLLNSLDARRREVVMLRLWGGLSFADISAVTDWPLSTVHDLYRAALAELRHQMENT